MLLVLLLLIAVAKAHWKFEPRLACKGSTGSDRLNVLGDQTLNI